MIKIIQQFLNAISSFFRGLFGGGDSDRPQSPKIGSPWVGRAMKDLGLEEVPGDGENPSIMTAWQHVDYRPPDGDETPYCAAKLNQWLEETGFPGTRQPNARSFEKWGKKLDKPKKGAIAVQWRVSPTDWRGHVGIYLGPGSKPGYFKCLGANQNDAINITEYPESKVLSYRWPVTGANSRTYRASGIGVIGAGAASSAVLESQTELLGIAKQIEGMAPSDLAFIGNFVTMLALGVVIWARYDDNKEKGR